MSDPRELPGLAHFCEHMLFLGTEKVIQQLKVYRRSFSGVELASFAGKQT